jgi:hypothetical protein
MENLLFKDETIISRSGDDNIVLTSTRIRQKSNNGVSSIMLDNIDSVRAQFESRPWLIGVGIACSLAAIVFYAGGEREFAGIAVIASVAFILMYFASRRHVITISSSSTSMVFQTKGMGNEQVLDFLNQVEGARKNVIERKYSIH